MKQNLIHLLGRGVNSMEGYIRPGCVHITMNAITNVQPEQNADGPSDQDGEVFACFRFGRSIAKHSPCPI